jgi:hypothetical protein
MAKGQTLNMKLKGLFTSPNNVSAVPVGALSEADNVVIDRPDIVESRRGQTQYGEPLDIGEGIVDKLFSFNNRLIVNYNNHLAYDSNNQGLWVEYDGIYEPANENYLMRSVESNRNFYFNDSNGVQKIDDVTQNPRPAGMPEALGGRATLTGTGGFLLANSAVAYRMIWSQQDANNNLVRGAPSSRLIVRNATPDNVDVSLSFTIPDGITVNDQYSIYRSFATINAADEPTDNLFLVVSLSPTGPEIAAKTFTFVDITPADLLNETLYTSPSQQGIANANFQPPLCTDMDLFKGSVWYANTTQKQRKVLTLTTAGLPNFGFTTISTVKVNSTTTLNGMVSTTNLHVGMGVFGTGIQADTEITEIISSSSVRISKPATSTGFSATIFRDYISVDGVKFYASSTNTPASNLFRLEDGYTPGINIDITANNLVDTINRSPTNSSVYAYYRSDSTNLPGRMEFISRGFSGGIFEIYSSADPATFVPNLGNPQLILNIATNNPPVINVRTTAGLNTGDIVTISGSNSTPSIDGDWTVTVNNAIQFTLSSPFIDVTGAGNAGTWIIKNKIVFSSADVNQNRVYVSKNQEPEAVPLYSYFDIGSANNPIDRVMALRDGIFFFKKDGIFRISGNSFANWEVSTIDSTVQLVSPETAVPLNNLIHCYTNQGACTVSGSGVEIISIPIEKDLLKLLSEEYTNLRNASFGVAYESSRQYMLFTVDNTFDGYATQAYLFNYITNTWTRWVMDRTCGIVNNNKLYMARLDGQILVERKSLTNSDYVDEQYEVEITDVISTTQLELADASNVEAGMSLVQGTETADSFIISSVDGNIITLEEEGFFVEGEAVVYMPIYNKITWCPEDADNAGYMKQFSEFTLDFRDTSFTEMQASVSNEIVSQPEAWDIVNTTTELGWGEFNWGEVPWGGLAGANQIGIRTYVPVMMQRCRKMNVTLELNKAFSGFALQGISLIWYPMDSRFR